MIFFKRILGNENLGYTLPYRQEPKSNKCTAHIDPVVDGWRVLHYWTVWYEKQILENDDNRTKDSCWLTRNVRGTKLHSTVQAYCW